MQISPLAAGNVVASSTSGNSHPRSSSESHSESSSANLGASQGISVAEGRRIDLSSQPMIYMPNALMPTMNQMSMGEYQEQLKSQGAEPQQAVIKQGNEIVATISLSGITTFQGDVGSRLNEASFNAGSDLRSIESFLQQEYGGRLSLQAFESGQQPSYSEVHNQVHGSSNRDSYDALVKRQSAEYQEYLTDTLLLPKIDIQA